MPNTKMITQAPTTANRNAMRGAGDPTIRKSNASLNAFDGSASLRNVLNWCLSRNISFLAFSWHDAWQPSALSLIFPKLGPCPHMSTLLGISLLQVDVPATTACARRFE